MYPVEKVAKPPSAPAVRGNVPSKTVRIDGLICKNGRGAFDFGFVGEKPVDHGTKQLRDGLFPPLRKLDQRLGARNREQEADFDNVTGRSHAGF